MKFTVYKFIYDTDAATGCDIFFKAEEAVNALYACVVAKGYDGLEDEEKIQEWLDALPGNADTYSIETEDINIPTATELADTMIVEIKKRPDLRGCRSFSELHDHCDANVLGGSEALLEKFPLETTVKLLNEAYTIVDDYLSTQKYCAVVGRQPDGENTVWLGSAHDEREALDAFVDQLCEDDGVSLAELDEQGGYIIEFIGWSDKPIGGWE